MAEAVIKLTAIDNVTKVVNSIGKSLERLTAPIAAIGALGATAGLQQFVGAVMNAVNALDDLDEAAQGLGVTAVQLSELRTAAQQSGLGFEQLDRLIIKFSAQLTAANAGNKDAIKLFESLGIAFKEAGKERAVFTFAPCHFDGSVRS